MVGVIELPAPFCWEGDHVRADLPGGAVVFTTRRGGVSAPPYDSLNLGPWTDDDPAAVAANRERAAALAGRPLAGVRQVHGTAVHRAHEPQTASVEADAVLTTRADLAVSVLVADCLPILLVAPRGVAAVHAGWRGLAAGILERSIAALLAATGDGPAEVQAAIGPGARGCCYEVGDEVRAAFAAHGPDVRRDGRIDLPRIASRLLADAAVGAVHDSGLCTLCAPDGVLFSHRRDHGTTGRQAGIAWRS